MRVQSDLCGNDLHVFDLTEKTVTVADVTFDIKPNEEWKIENGKAQLVKKIAY